MAAWVQDVVAARQARLKTPSDLPPATSPDGCVQPCTSVPSTTTTITTSKVVSQTDTNYATTVVSVASETAGGGETATTGTPALVSGKMDEGYSDTTFEIRSYDVENCNSLSVSDRGESSFSMDSVSSAEELDN